MPRSLPIRQSASTSRSPLAAQRGLRAGLIALAIGGAAALGGPATGQTLGCGRCGNTITIGPFSFPNPFAAPPAGYAPGWEERRWQPRSDDGGGSRSRRHASAKRDGATSGETSGGSIYVCVRTCDGSFFPLPYAGSSGVTLEQVCQALCPNAEMALYAMPFGGTINDGTAPNGTRYSSLPNALKFQQSFEESCSCRRPAQSWAEALAAAEARFGRHGANEFVVTAEESVRLSRPKIDPRAKLQAASAVAPAPASAAEAGIDLNGVDTKLKAATAAVSRETSGIKDDDAAAGSYLGLKQGRVVSESSPDGGSRRVRILTSSY